MRRQRHLRRPASRRRATAAAQSITSLASLGDARSSNVKRLLLLHVGTRRGDVLVDGTRCLPADCRMPLPCVGAIDRSVDRPREHVVGARLDVAWRACWSTVDGDGPCPRHSHLARNGFFWGGKADPTSCAARPRTIDDESRRRGRRRRVPAPSVGSRLLSPPTAPGGTHSAASLPWLNRQTEHQHGATMSPNVAILFFIPSYPLSDIRRPPLQSLHRFVSPRVSRRI